MSGGITVERLDIMKYRKVEVLPNVTFKIGFVEPVPLDVADTDDLAVDAASQATQLLREYIEDVFDPRKLSSLGIREMTLEFIENSEADVELMDADIDEEEFFTVDSDDIQY